MTGAHVGHGAAHTLPVIAGPDWQSPLPAQFRQSAIHLRLIRSQMRPPEAPDYRGREVAAA